MTLTRLSDKIFRPKSLRSFHPSIHPSLGDIQGTHCAHRKYPPKEEETVGLEGSQKSLHVTCTGQPPGLGHPCLEQLESASHWGTLHHQPQKDPQSPFMMLHHLLHVFFSGLSSTCYIWGQEHLTPFPKRNDPGSVLKSSLMSGC